MHRKSLTRTRRMLRAARLGIFFLSLVFMASCGSRTSETDYIRTVQSGIRMLPWPSQMEALFGEGDHFLIQYRNERNPKEWQSRVFLYGMYELTMTVEVNIDWQRRTIKKIISA